MSSNSFDTYRLTSGNIVYGKTLDENQILYATKNNQTNDTQILVGEVDEKINVDSLERKLANPHLEGMRNFPQNQERVLGIRQSPSPDAFVETYTLFERNDDHIRSSEVMFVNGQIITTREKESELPLQTNLREDNYFFDSTQFVTGEKALQEYERIEKKGENKQYFI